MKPDWSNNDGTNVDWIDDSVGWLPLEYSSLTLIENSITFDDTYHHQSTVTADGQLWGDAFYWETASDIKAGTVLKGTLTVTGENIFDTSVNAFQLVSGFDNDNSGWNRLEAQASYSTPAASTLALFAIGLIVLAWTKEKSRS